MRKESRKRKRENRLHASETEAGCVEAVIEAVAMFDGLEVVSRNNERNNSGEGMGMAGRVEWRGEAAENSQQGGSNGERKVSVHGSMVVANFWGIGNGGIVCRPAPRPALPCKSVRWFSALAELGCLG